MNHSPEHLALTMKDAAKLVGVIFMFGAIVMLVILPWLDTSRVRSAVYRPVFKILFWVFIACVIGLGYLGSQPPEGGAVTAGPATRKACGRSRSGARSPSGRDRRTSC